MEQILLRVLYFNEIRNKRMDLELKNKYPDQNQFIFGNMDEVPIQFDMSTGKVYDFRGKRQINLLRSTGIKKKFTLVLAMLSDRTKLPMMIIFKNLSSIPRKLKKNLRMMQSLCAIRMA